jgi:cytochrome b6-f complex iron-sulfur subunit
MSATPPNAESTSNVKFPKKFSRRDFLSLTGKTLLAISGVIGLAEVAMYLSYQPDPSSPTSFDLGPASQYPVGSRTLAPEARAVLLHLPGGFTALSLVCPHLGCTLEMKEDAYLCPCHGSKFNPDGSLVNGPANKPMQVLEVEETPEGNLILFTA